MAAFIISALITPTADPLNQILVAVPLIVLYELGVLLARLARRGEGCVACQRDDLRMGRQLAFGGLAYGILLVLGGFGLVFAGDGPA